MQKTFNNMWVVVDSKDNVYWSTLSRFERKAIHKMTQKKDVYWQTLLNDGYTCVKVNVTFDIVKPENK